MTLPWPDTGTSRNLAETILLTLHRWVFLDTSGGTIDLVTGDGIVLAINGLLHNEFLAHVAPLPRRDWAALHG